MIVLFSFLIGCMTSPKLVIFARSRFRVLDPSSVANVVTVLKFSERIDQSRESGCIYTAEPVVPLYALASDWLAAVSGCAEFLARFDLRALGKACRSWD